jgi:hypothetical protein
MKGVGSGKIKESLIEYGRSRLQEDVGIPAGVWKDAERTG